MGIVVNASEPAIDYLLYGDKSHVISNYLYNQLNSLPQVFNDFSERIHNTLATAYNFVTDKLTQYGILNELKNNGVAVDDNYIQELLSFEQLQNANLTMQRWVMAHPQVRELYLEQNIDGYSETYKNVFGREVGDRDYNYRLVNDGNVMLEDDHFVIKHYIGDLLPGDRELDHREKAAILNTWDAIDWILDNCDFDFTVKSDEPVKINRE